MQEFQPHLTKLLFPKYEKICNEDQGKLVFLKPPYQVRRLLPSQTTKIYFFEDESNQPLNLYVCDTLGEMDWEKVQNQTQTIERMKQQNRLVTKIILIASPASISKINIFIPYIDELIFVYQWFDFYDFQRCQSQAFKELKTLVFYTNLDDLKQKLSYEKYFPNFVSLEDKTRQFNIRRVNINCMIDQQYSDEQQIIQKFEALVRMKLGENVMQNLYSFYMNANQYKKENVIKIYTSESYFHKIINSLLRTSMDPLQLYYIQPFVSHLSKKIKQKYQTQADHRKELFFKKQDSSISSYSNQSFEQNLSKSSKLKSDGNKEWFQFYRAAIFNDKQFDYLKDNKGKLIESLGFLSTSTSQQTVINSFQFNTLVLFKVENHLWNPDDPGFAFAFGESQYVYQQEVLFNVGSIFMIQSVDLEYKTSNSNKSLSSTCRKIILVYKTISQVKKKYNNKDKLDENQQHLLYFNFNFNQKIYIQHQCLNNLNGYSKVTIDYCKCFIEMKIKKMDIYFLWKYLYLFRFKLMKKNFLKQNNMKNERKKFNNILKIIQLLIKYKNKKITYQDFMKQLKQYFPYCQLFTFQSYQEGYYQWLENIFFTYVFQLQILQYIDIDLKFVKQLYQYYQIFFKQNQTTVNIWKTLKKQFIKKKILNVKVDEKINELIIDENYPLLMQYKMNKKIQQSLKQNKDPLSLTELAQIIQNSDKLSGLGSKSFMNSYLYHLTPSEIQAVYGVKIQMPEDKFYHKQNQNSQIHKMRGYKKKIYQYSFFQKSLNEFDIQRENFILYFEMRLDQLISTNVKIDLNKVNILLSYIKNYFGSTLFYRKFYYLFKQKEMNGLLNIQDFECNMNLQKLYNCNNLNLNQLKHGSFILIDDNNKQKFLKNVQYFKQVFKSKNNATYIKTSCLIILKLFYYFKQKKQSMKYLIQIIKQLKQNYKKYEMFNYCQIQQYQQIMQASFIILISKQIMCIIINTQTTFQFVQFLLNLSIVRMFHSSKISFNLKNHINILLRHSYKKRSAFIQKIQKCLSVIEVQTNSDKMIQQKFKDLYVLIFFYDGPWSTFYPTLQSLLQKYSNLQITQFFKNEQWQSLFQQNQEKEKYQKCLQQELLNMKTKAQIDMDKKQQNDGPLFQLQIIYTFYQIYDENKGRFIQNVKKFKQQQVGKNNKNYLQTNMVILNKFIIQKQKQSKQIMKQILQLFLYNLPKYNKKYDYCNYKQFRFFVKLFQNKQFKSFYTQQQLFYLQRIQSFVVLQFYSGQDKIPFSQRQSKRQQMIKHLFQVDSLFFQSMTTFARISGSKEMKGFFQNVNLFKLI